MQLRSLMRRIGINLIHVDPNYAGGVTAYARGIAEGFSQHSSKIDLVYFLSSKNSDYFDFVDSNSGVETRILGNAVPMGSLKLFKSKPRVLKVLPNFMLDLMNFMMTREQVRILEHVDLMYTPYGPPPVFPYISKPQIFSIHDIQHEYFPEFFTSDQLVERKYTFGRVAKLAAGVQASSTQMLENFTNTYQELNENNVRVIPEGVDISYFGTPAEQTSTMQIQSVLNENYYYMPAQLWPHKNHETVIEAVRLIKKANINAKLVLTGAPYSAYQQIINQIDRAGLNEIVVYLGVVERNDVRALYQSSRGVISSALYESNSLPILEAAASKVKVFAGDTPPNLELSKSISINIFNNKSPSALADLIIANETGALDSTPLQNPKDLEKFKWANVAIAYIDWFEEILAASSDKTP